MTDTADALHPTTPQLLKATAIALAVAIAILFCAILPAEYGLDPTGIGAALGLSALHAPESVAATAEAPATPVAQESVIKPESSVSQHAAAFRADEMQLTLAPNAGGEIKAQMRAGESLVFSWAVEGGVVNFDMHGERPNDGDNFSSYWKGRDQGSGHGSFIAPFDGSHGWYWRNRGQDPVTVTVKVSGYFDRLYRPGP